MSPLEKNDGLLLGLVHANKALLKFRCSLRLSGFYFMG